MQCDRLGETIGAYLDQELDPVARREVAAHLASCPACAALAEELQRIGPAGGGVGARARAGTSRGRDPGSARRPLHQDLGPAPSGGGDRSPASATMARPGRRPAPGMRADGGGHRAGDVADGRCGPAGARCGGGPRAFPPAGQPHTDRLVRHPHGEAVVRRPPGVRARRQGPRGRRLPAGRRPARLHRRAPRRRPGLPPPAAHSERVPLAVGRCRRQRPLAR